MKQIAMTLDLRDDKAAIEAYVVHHKEVWPEVISALRKVGVVDMKIWLWGKRLFMLMHVPDGFDPQRDFATYLSLHPRCQEWEDLMETFQQPLEGTLAGEKWVEMEQVFALPI